MRFLHNSDNLGNCYLMSLTTHQPSSLVKVLWICCLYALFIYSPSFIHQFYCVLLILCFLLVVFSALFCLLILPLPLRRQFFLPLLFELSIFFFFIVYSSPFSFLSFFSFSYFFALVLCYFSFLTSPFYFSSSSFLLSFLSVISLSIIRNKAYLLLLILFFCSSSCQFLQIYSHLQENSFQIHILMSTRD